MAVLRENGAHEAFGDLRQRGRCGAQDAVQWSSQESEERIEQERCGVLEAGKVRA